MKTLLIISRVLSPLAWLGMAVLLGLTLLIPFERGIRHVSEYLQYGDDFNRWASATGSFGISRWSFFFWTFLSLIAVFALPEWLFRIRTWMKLRAVQRGACAKCGFTPREPAATCLACSADLASQPAAVKKIRFRLTLANVLQGLMIFLCGWVMVAGLVLRIIGEIDEHPFP